MAVLVEFTVPGATPEQIYSVEAKTQERGEQAGRPPYPGCMFLAVTAYDGGFRFVSAWRTEADFHTVLETMLTPDLGEVGLAVAGVTAVPVVGMAIPGAHG